MNDWDNIDEQAYREAIAIKGSHKSKRPRSPGGLPKEYVMSKRDLDKMMELDIPVTCRRDDNVLQTGTEALRSFGKNNCR
ncbi:MAG: hypothetical protein WC942_04945 [Clostridia bacterium]|jgi:hypothetical protein